MDTDNTVYECTRLATAYMTRLYCRACNTEMTMGREVYLTNPEQYCYSCPQCGGTYRTSEVYPQVSYK